MVTHEVNFACVRRCYTDQVWTFNTLGEFVNWLLRIKKKCTMFAHNFKGYDGRLVLDAIHAKNGTVGRLIMQGSKVLGFDVGCVSFRDTLL